MFCSATRIACSLACAPNCTVCDESTRTVELARADPGPELPVYQATVLAEPFTRVVALPSGVVPTRSGGWAAVTGLVAKPSDPRAAEFELVIDRLAASSVLMV